MNNPGERESINKIVDLAASTLGYLIYDSAVFIKGENSRINVKIDSLKGISIYDCEVYSKELTRLLDDARLLPNYTLEVSSPGTNRKLRSLDEFLRFKGSPAKVIYDIDGNRTFARGIIDDVNGNIITLNSDKEAVKLDYNTVSSANLELK